MSSEESAGGYVEGYDGEPAERIVGWCDTCGARWAESNTEDGFNHVADMAASHIDDDYHAQSPCVDTRMKAVFGDGSEMEVA